MTFYHHLVRRWWPRQTLGAAHLEWQAQENRLAEAQARLARDCEALGRQAEQAQMDAEQGVLRAARLRLEQPLDAGLLRAKQRLQRAFDRLGRGFFRRLPSPLEVELGHYAAGMEQTCRGLDGLAGRLRLAQALLLVFARHPEFCRPDCFRLALTAPESAWLLFHLCKKRFQARQAA
jgi:hypothetical protein